jgi:hypothetical protein
MHTLAIRKDRTLEISKSNWRGGSPEEPAGAILPLLPSARLRGVC